MKRFLQLLGAICFILLTSNVECKAQVQVDTIYYDGNWKGVEISSFATYVRITMVPEDPNYAKRFRDFNYLTNKIYREGTFIEVDKYDDEKSVFDGLLSWFNDDAKVIQSVNYVNGVVDGEVIEYFPDGSIQSFSVYKDGKKSGVSKLFSKSGVLLEESTYENNILNGPAATYSETGVIKSKSVYSGGKLNGKCESFDSKGEMISSITFVDDIQDGPAQFYYENGNLRDEAVYKNGKLNGPAKMYDENGKLTHDLEFVDDEYIGKYNTFEDGKPLYQGVMAEGQSFTGTVYTYDEGVLESSCPYEDNKLKGIATYYYPDGKIQCQMTFDNDLLNGYTYRNDERGTKYFEAYYKNDLPVGRYDMHGFTSTYYHELIPSDGLNGVSVCVEAKEYPVTKSVKLRTVNDKPIESDKSRGTRVYKVLSFKLDVLNNTDAVTSYTISDISVNLLKKGRPYENIAISEDITKVLLEEYTEKYVSDAFASARNTADRAATQRTTNSSYGSVTTTGSTTTRTGAAAAASGSTVAAALGGNNLGYVAGGVGAASTSVSGAAATSAKTTTFGSTSSNGITTSTHVDGGVRYQVYQQESEVATQKATAAYKEESELLYQATISSFSCPAESEINKIFLSSAINQSCDQVQLVLTINGQKCKAVWSVPDLK